MIRKFVFIASLVIAVSFGLSACEKKQQPPQPATQPVAVPAPPAPAPAPAPAPVPAPALEPAKPAKK